MVDQACSMLERAAGVKLQRGPTAGKVKFMALGRWQGTLTQEDFPYQYVQLSDHLDFVGMELRATYTQTRKVNVEQLQAKVKNTVGPWKAERFMPITLRPTTMHCLKSGLNAKDKSSNWAKACADLFEDCSVDLSFALEKATRKSKNVFHKSNI